VRTLVIGDIHGCFDELPELLDRASLADGDRIVALGDIVDRGPATPGVLDFFARRGGENVVLGNHERKHIRSYRGETQPALSQIICREQIGEAGYAEAVAFMSVFPRRSSSTATSSPVSHWNRRPTRCSPGPCRARDGCSATGTPGSCTTAAASP
jgi:hypothetical protein